MTFGGLLHSAPSGLAGKAAKGLFSVGTSMVNAIHLPSGDQAIDPGDFCTLVTLASCPLSIQRTKIWVLPSTAEEKSRRRPSGDQRGELSLAVLAVRGRKFEPSKSTIQRLDRLRSFMISLELR